jgi:cysteine desulfurase
MNPRRTYLDHNASAPVRPEAKAAMLAALELAGNPSSVHAEGRAARGVIERARADVATLVGAPAAEVVFTSGGSEAVNTVIRSGYDAILHAGIEHDCVRETASATGSRIVEIPVDGRGLVSEDGLERALEQVDAARSRVLVCLQLANNETGVVQDVGRLAERARQQGAEVFCDAVQAAGKLPLDLAALHVDAIAISGHKIGGPKGVGALVSRAGWRSVPLVRGGGQEQRRRAGTENVVGIAGFGAAARAAQSGLADMARIAALRDRLEAGVRRLSPDLRIPGETAPRLANTSCLIVPGRGAETTLIAFDLAGIAISSGAACSSGKVAPSKVLAAMGIPAAEARCALRVSLGWSSRADDVERFLAVWQQVVVRPDRHRVA